MAIRRFIRQLEPPGVKFYSKHPASIHTHLVWRFILINMIKEFVILIWTPFQNRKGKSKLKLLASYAAFALKSKRNVKVLTPKSTLKSKIWSNYQKYLLFQVKYIDPKFWAKSPLILAVAGGYANPIKLEHNSLPRKKILQVMGAAEKYSNFFDGFSQKDFVDWLTLYCVMLEHFRKDIEELEKEKIDIIAEIGPGILPVALLSTEVDDFNFMSYDTSAMQLLQKELANKIFSNPSKISFISTDSASGEILQKPTKNYAIYAFWSFTEISQDERQKFNPIIQNSNYALIVSNTIFEGTNNFEYISGLCSELGKRCKSATLEDVLGSQIPNFMKRHQLFLLF